MAWLLEVLEVRGLTAILHLGLHRGADAAKDLTSRAHILLLVRSSSNEGTGSETKLSKGAVGTYLTAVVPAVCEALAAFCDACKSAYFSSEDLNSW